MFNSIVSAVLSQLAGRPHDTASFLDGPRPHPWSPVDDLYWPWPVPHPNWAIRAVLEDIVAAAHFDATLVHLPEGDIKAQFLRANGARVAAAIKTIVDLSHGRPAPDDPRPVGPAARSALVLHAIASVVPATPTRDLLLHESTKLARGG
ncbi:MAG: hypothetical protein QM820_43955 [Minicystis sp.]